MLRKGPTSLLEVGPFVYSLRFLCKKSVFPFSAFSYNLNSKIFRSFVVPSQASL